MTTTTLAVIAVALLLPIICLIHLTKSRPQRLREMRARGWSWKQCGAVWGVTGQTAKRWSMA